MYTVVATLLRSMPGRLSASDLKSVLSEYVNGLPESVFRLLRRVPAWIDVGGPGALGASGVPSGMVFGAVSRAS